jgi:type II secretory pathway component PulF
VVYLVVATISFFAEPRVEVLAKDFKMDLPGYTKLFFAFNRWFRQELGWLWLLPIPGAVPVALTRLVQLGKGSREIRHWRLVGITSMILLLIGIASAMAIVVPVYQLVYQISSPAPKH